MMFKFADGTGNILEVDLRKIESKKHWGDEMKKNCDMYIEKIQHKIKDLSGLMKHPKIEAKVNDGDNDSPIIQRAFNINSVSAVESEFKMSSMSSVYSSSNSLLQAKSSSSVSDSKTSTQSDSNTLNVSSAESDSITVFDVPIL